MATSGEPTVNKKKIKHTEKDEDNVGNKNGEDNVRSKKGILFLLLIFI